MSKLGSEPAYPQKWVITYSDIDNYISKKEHYYPGMTIRQAYVMAAMQALVTTIYQTEGHGWSPKLFANEAIGIADVCLKREAETRDE